jgi:hypothetical protein
VGAPLTDCSSDSDCAGECPAESIACVCFVGFDGSGFCVPECSTDADCPTDMECVDLEGICGPSGGGLDAGTPPPSDF